MKRIMKIPLMNTDKVALVSEQDYEELSKYQWSLFRQGKYLYAIRAENGKTHFMHRDIIGVTDPTEYVDHKNGDGLNNRRRNLRVCRNRYNQYNVHKKSTSGQKYKCIRKVHNRWEVRVRIPSGKRLVRSAHSEREAVEIYNQIVREYHGEFAFIQQYTP